MTRLKSFLSWALKKITSWECKNALRASIKKDRSEIKKLQPILTMAQALNQWCVSGAEMYDSKKLRVELISLSKDVSGKIQYRQSQIDEKTKLLEKEEQAQ